MGPARFHCATLLPLVEFSKLHLFIVMKESEMLHHPAFTYFMRSFVIIIRGYG